MQIPLSLSLRLHSYCSCPCSVLLPPLPSPTTSFSHYIFSILSPETRFHWKYNLKLKKKIERSLYRQISRNVGSFQCFYMEDTVLVLGTQKYERSCHCLCRFYTLAIQQASKGVDNISVIRFKAIRDDALIFLPSILISDPHAFTLQ